MNNEREFDLLPLLDHINPAVLSYQEWINVGMALKHERIYRVRLGQLVAK